MSSEPQSQTFDVTDTADPATRRVIGQAMLSHNETFLGPSASRPLAVLVRDTDGTTVIGGLWGRTSHQFLFVEMLFLPETLRGQRLGETLLRRAEAEAHDRGCVGAWLDTFSPDAKRFYERQGYTGFGELRDHPVGHTRFFLRKTFPTP